MTIAKFFKRTKSEKEKITEVVLSELPLDHQDHTIPFDTLMFKWWATSRQEGLRLTEHGDKAFKDADLAHYDYNIDITQLGEITWLKFLTDVNKKINCPYYLQLHKKISKTQYFIRLYDSKIAMLVSLHGSIEKYLKTVI